MIIYTKEDIFSYKYPYIIAHVCNNVGAWGSGFTAAIDKKYPEVKLFYKEFKNKDLGSCQAVGIKNILFYNMIAMNGIRSKKNIMPLRYEALDRCLRHVKLFSDNFPVHMPKIGSGLAGGDWDKIEEMLNKVFANKEVFVHLRSV